MRWFEARAIDYTVLSPDRSREVRDSLSAIDPKTDAAERWRRVSTSVLRPSDPFSLHLSLFEENYRGWSASRGPQPAVLPTTEAVSSSNLAVWLRELGMESYEELHAYSVSNVEGFLGAVLERLRLEFTEPPAVLCDLSGGVEHPRWLEGAVLNIADAALGGEPDREAIHFRNARHEDDRWSLARLRATCGRVANGLAELGLKPGDAVAVDMPMTALSVAIYLGIAAAGMTVVSVADSFAEPEIAARLRIAGAKAVFTTDVIVRGERRLGLYDRVRRATELPTIVVPAADRLEVALRAGDRAFDDFLSARETFSTVPRRPDDAINILFSSGTTGDPKAIPWTHTTPIRCALDGLAHQDIRKGDIVAWPTNLGWMMGPWLIFATLMNEATIALFEGLPQTRDFGRFVQDAGVSVLGVVPSLVRTWKESGCMSGLDWSRIKAFSSTGEASSRDEMLYLMSLAGYRPVIEYCGGTEVGGAYLSSTLIQPNSPACFSARTLGIDSVILDDEDRVSSVGEIYLVPPALGLSTTLLNASHHAVYFEGCPRHEGKVLRRHGDEVEELPAGYFRAHGRSDDTMNLGGIKVSSVELERAMGRVGGVVETAAIAVPPSGGGPSRLVVYAVLEPGAPDDPVALKAELQGAIRSNLNPLFKISDVIRIDSLPRTASNKVMRRALRSAYKDPSP